MKKNVYPLRISLAAVTVLLLFADLSFAALTHTVKSKETLYQISKKYGTSVSVICKANGLAENGTLKVGQTLTIPSGSSVKSSSKAKYGVCRKDGGDVWDGNELIASLKKGTKFEILARDDYKVKVKLSNGKTGWILDNWVESSSYAPRPAVVVDRGGFKYTPSKSKSGDSDIVHMAMAFRGARYSRGGMSSRGFDCSGFTKYVYSKKGISLPHSSSAQFKCGKPVSKSELVAGDLVFFAGTYKRGISHVGMYIGDGKFIHASTSRGGVRVDDLNGAYYRRKYAGARRL